MSSTERGIPWQKNEPESRARARRFSHVCQLTTPALDKSWSCTPCRTESAGLPKSACSGQAPLRHPEVTAYRCFLPDLAGFTGSCRAGPNLHHHLTRQSRPPLSPRGGIRPRYGGLRVQGTASSPSSTTICMLPQNGGLVNWGFRLSLAQASTSNSRDGPSPHRPTKL
jgi:hypothetical protein